MCTKSWFVSIKHVDTGPISEPGTWDTIFHLESLALLDCKKFSTIKDSCAIKSAWSSSLRAPWKFLSLRGVINTYASLSISIFIQYRLNNEKTIIEMILDQQLLGWFIYLFSICFTIFIVQVYFRNLKGLRFW